MKLEDSINKFIKFVRINAGAIENSYNKELLMTEIKQWAKGCVSEKQKPSSLVWDFHDCRIWKNCRKETLKNIEEQ